MNAHGTAIFLEPAGPLLEAIRERKAWLESIMPGQPYCAHPPHCTLVFGDYGTHDCWLTALRDLISRFPDFTVETDGWQEFPNDALAGGGHTVAYRVRMSPALARLQLTIAECLAPFKQCKLEAHPFSRAEPFASSLRQYGFPFVGQHWLPHFTIASPKLAAGDERLAAIMSGPVKYSFHVNRLSVWRVEGDMHDRLHELALDGGPT